jgi:general secretion pathway protein K
MPRLGPDAAKVCSGMTMSAPPRSSLRRARPRAHRQRGIALVLALWLTILLTVIGSGFAFSMRSEVLAARNMVSLAQVRAAANGAIERTAYELSRPRLTDSWAADGAPHTWQDGDITLVATATDESAKIDLNSATDALLRNLFLTIGGASPDATAHIVDAIRDWQDPDDLTRPNGAEEADYRAAGLKYKPANAPFETVTELARVMGVTPAIYANVADSLTVHSRQPGVNAATASRTVLLALPGTTAETVDAFLQQRSAALAAKQPIPAFPPAQAFAAGATGVWRIRAQATAADGVTFAREAVVRPSGDPRRPLIALAWLDDIAPAPAAAAEAGSDPAATKNANGRP